MDITTLTLESEDVAAAEAFYEAFGIGEHINVETAKADTSGFRGYHLSLVVAQPNIVDAWIGAALEAGATTLKPAKKGFWGYGGVVQAPDGAIWKIATSNKKDSGPATRTFDDIVLLLGVDDVKATKQFYVDRGFAVGKSFGGKYVEFASTKGHVKFALLNRRALAKDAGVPAEGAGAHRIVIGSGAGQFTDPDGFAWEPTA